MRKKVLSLALALVMCLGLTIPTFAVESKWKLEVPGKSKAEMFLDKKTFTLRDCGVYDYDPSIGETVLYKEDDLQWTAENVCVLERATQRYLPIPINRRNLPIINYSMAVAIVEKTLI